MLISKNIFAAAIILAITLSLIGNSYGFILILSMILLIVLIYSKKEIVVVLIVLISYLTFTGPKLVSDRMVLNISALILLTVLFLMKFGFDFKRYPKIPRSLIFLILLLFLSFTLSTIVNGLPAISIAALFRMSVFFFICYLLYAFINTKKELLYYISTLFLVFLIISTGIYIEIIESGFSIFGRTGFFARYSGFYESPNYVGLVLMVVSLFTIVLLFKNNLVNRYYKYGLIFLIINIVVVSIIINSRASLLGTVVGLLTIFAFYRKVLLFKTLAALGIISFILIQIPEIQELIDLFLRLETISEREHLWNAGVKMFIDFPVFGVAPDMFREYFFNYVPSSAFLLIQSIHLGGSPHSHNFFLFLANENGILGFISAISIFILFFYYSYQSISLAKKHDKDYYLIALASFGICSGYFVRAFFDVEGILAYGYLTRDLPFWLVFIISVFIYQKFNHNNKDI